MPWSLLQRPGVGLALVLATTLGVCAPALWNGFAYDGAWVAQVGGNDAANPLVASLHAPWVYWSHHFHHSSCR